MLKEKGLWALLGLLAFSVALFYVGGELSLGYENANFGANLVPKPVARANQLADWVTQRALLISLFTGFISLLGIVKEMEKEAKIRNEPL